MIKLYSKKGCAECILLERKLMNNHIEFEKMMIEELEPEDIARVMQESGRKKMPVVEQDNKFLSQEEIEKLLS